MPRTVSPQILELRRHLGRELRRHRIATGISQEMLGEGMGANQARITAAELQTPESGGTPVEFVIECLLALGFTMGDIGLMIAACYAT